MDNIAKTLSVVGSIDVVTEVTGGISATIVTFGGDGSDRLKSELEAAAAGEVARLKKELGMKLIESCYIEEDDCDNHDGCDDRYSGSYFVVMQVDQTAEVS